MRPNRFSATYLILLIMQPMLAVSSFIGSGRACAGGKVPHGVTRGLRKRWVASSIPLAFVSTTTRRSARTKLLPFSYSAPVVDVACRLFFRSRDTSTRRLPQRKLYPPTWIIEQLQSPTLAVPFSFQMQHVDGQMDDTEFLVRCMTVQDLDTIIPMCIAEFGSMPTATNPNGLPMQTAIPSWNRMNEWWDRIYFAPMLSVALRAKIHANNHVDESRKSKDEGWSFHDPTVLVLSRQGSLDSVPVIVGMVEISLQVPESNRNPPAFPIPLWFKRWYAGRVGLPLEGWITNLLIGNEYRGLGYSKILLAATEGIARSWNVTSIYLHADADIRSGRIPQRLYESLGYKVVVDDNPQYAWMSDGYNFNSRIHMVDGAPLLFYCKRLEHGNQ